MANRNKRRAASQELRLASSSDQRVSYVVGAYFADTNAAVGQIAETTNEAFLEFSGMSIEQRYGVPFNGFFASGAYSPDSSDVPAQKSINLRLGFEYGAFDVNLFALNVTDETKGPRFGGRSQCTNADCSAYNSYTYGATVAAPLPRQVGIQLAYRR